MGESVVQLVGVVGCGYRGGIFESGLSGRGTGHAKNPACEGMRVLSGIIALPA